MQPAEELVPVRVQHRPPSNKQCVSVGGELLEEEEEEVQVDPAYQ